MVYKFQTRNKKIKLLTVYESVTQEVLFDNAVLAALLPGTNMTPYLKMATVQEKAMCILWFSETKSLITTQLRYTTQYGKDPPSENAIRR
jgi:hypothetical protein